MSEFGAELRRRFRRAEAALQTAREAGDHYAADVHTGEIDSLRRLADEHDVRLEDRQPDQD